MSVPEVPLDEVTEGTTRLLVPRSAHVKGPKAKEGVPFYNPAMRPARDLSIAVLRAAAAGRTEPVRVCDAMASLGARGLRMANEASPVHVLLNDVNVDALQLAHRNAERLGLRNVDFRLGRLEPLLADERFDWVDIDPFGTPAPYLDFAAHSARDGGILAVTATDKAALCGVYPDVCLRRYNARPRHGPCMDETGTRILVAAVARAAGRRDRFIEPLLAHSTGHYVRLYVRVRDGAAPSSRQADNLGYAVVDDHLRRRLASRPPPGVDWAGPLWTGPLADGSFLKEVQAHLGPDASRDVTRLVEALQVEAAAPPLYYTIDDFTRASKRNAPRLEALLARLREEGWVATRTHFTPRGFRTDAAPRDVLRVISA